MTPGEIRSVSTGFSESLLLLNIYSIANLRGYNGIGSQLKYSIFWKVLDILDYTEYSNYASFLQEAWDNVNPWEKR